MDALQRFYDKAAPAASTAACKKSRNGRHWFIGYKIRNCRWCGQSKDDA